VSFSRRHVHLIVERKQFHARVLTFLFLFFEKLPQSTMTELSIAIADEKTRFEGQLISMCLHKAEIGAALDAFGRAVLKMRSGTNDNERLKILHVMCQDIIAVIGGLHELIGADDDDAAAGGKQKATHTKPAKPRDFLMDALEAWR
jgi:hypothetical protein